jgi:peptidoglycan hydrolase-like protein with peptidoglycan-binding domain
MADLILTPSSVVRPGLSTTPGVVYLDTSPADPGAPAAGFRPLRRVSETYGAPTLADGVPQSWAPASVVREDVGYLHVYIDGADRTVFRGAPTYVDSWTLMDPFGCGPATIRFPKVSGFDQIGAGATGFLRRGASVDIYLVTPGGTRVQPPLWSGEIVRRVTTSSGRGTSFECVGDLHGPATLAIHKPSQYVPLSDRGTLVIKGLNYEVLTRRVGYLGNKLTGKLTAARGSSSQSVTEYVQETLPLGWTVRRRPYRRSYELAERAPGSTWTVSYGTPGGRRRPDGGPDGGTERDLRAGCATRRVRVGELVLPRSARGAAAVPEHGSEQPDQSGGDRRGDRLRDGVTQIQERINQLNLTGDVRVTGSYDAATEAAVRAIQGRSGITVDGVVAGQTWNVLFPLYSGVQIGKEIRLTVAGDDRVVPRLYAADGTDIGANPGYNSRYLRVEREENLGSGITKFDGITSCSEEFQRTIVDGQTYPGWVGTVTLRLDPQEGSRFLIREADRLRVRYFQGGDVDLHIGQVQARPSDGPGSVTLTVDELARDLPTIAAIIRQDEDSKDDPLRLPGRRARRTQINPDAVEPFDGESSAGRLPRIPLFAGLWTVQAIPLSAAGENRADHAADAPGDHVLRRVLR